MQNKTIKKKRGLKVQLQQIRDRLIRTCFALKVQLQQTLFFCKVYIHVDELYRNTTIKKGKIKVIVKENIHGGVRFCGLI